MEDFKLDNLHLLCYKSIITGINTWKWVQSHHCINVDNKEARDEDVAYFSQGGDQMSSGFIKEFYLLDEEYQSEGTEGLHVPKNLALF